MTDWDDLEQTEKDYLSVMNGCVMMVLVAGAVFFGLLLFILRGIL